MSQQSYQLDPRASYVRSNPNKSKCDWQIVTQNFAGLCIFWHVELKGHNISSCQNSDWSLTLPIFLIVSSLCGYMHIQKILHLFKYLKFARKADEREKPKRSKNTLSASHWKHHIKRQHTSTLRMPDSLSIKNRIERIQKLGKWFPFEDDALTWCYREVKCELYRSEIT